MMSAQRIEVIRDYLKSPNIPPTLREAFDELLIDAAARDREAYFTDCGVDPGQLFPRGHALLKASPAFQAMTATALLASYARSLLYSPNAAALRDRLADDLEKGVERAELIALHHEAEWTDTERRFMNGRAKLRKILNLAVQGALFAELGAVIAREQATEGSGG